MALYRLTPPALEPVSLKDAYRHLKIEDRIAELDESPPGGEADLVDALVKSATAHLDGIDGVLGRALISQQWKMTADAFPACFHLPLPPLIRVDEIEYVDGNGVGQTLATDQYQIVGAGGSSSAMIEPAYGASWPATRAVREAVSVTFTCGYGDNPDDVPAPLRAAIKLLLGHLYENREASVIGTIVAELPFAVQALIAPYRVWSLT